jgi:hypothetical protein
MLDPLIEQYLTQCKRASELERALEDIYINTVNREDGNLLFFCINQTIKGVLKEHRIAHLDACWKV